MGPQEQQQPASQQPAPSAVARLVEKAAAHVRQGPVKTRHVRRVTIRQADEARDNGQPARAALLYQAAIDQSGATFGLLVQLGNTLKDSGALGKAEQAYEAALRLNATNADCHLQLGHVMKLAGRLPRAEQCYAKAHAIDPALTGPVVELDAIQAQKRAGTWDPGAGSPAEPDPAPGLDRHSRSFIIHRRLLGSLASRRT